MLCPYAPFKIVHCFYCCFFSGIFHAVLFSFFFFLAGVVVSLLVAEIVCATNELYFVLIS